MATKSKFENMRKVYYRQQKKREEVGKEKGKPKFKGVRRKEKERETRYSDLREKRIEEIEEKRRK